MPHWVTLVRGGGGGGREVSLAGATSPESHALCTYVQVAVSSPPVHHTCMWALLHPAKPTGRHSLMWHSTLPQLQPPADSLMASCSVDTLGYWLPQNCGLSTVCHPLLPHSPHWQHNVGEGGRAQRLQLLLPPEQQGNGG